LDALLAAAGFEDRTLPDGRVLRICRDGEHTISDVGRELGITRQGAAKLVGSLRDRGYVSVDASPTSGREKVVTLTARATAYLDARRRAARTIERELERTLGPEALDALSRLVAALDDGTDELRLLEYVRARSGFAE
jgi:DNA-binding MarR family transcriptional regulator